MKSLSLFSVVGAGLPYKLLARLLHRLLVLHEHLLNLIPIHLNELTNFSSLPSTVAKIPSNVIST